MKTWAGVLHRDHPAVRLDGRRRAIDSALRAVDGDAAFGREEEFAAYRSLTSHFSAVAGFVDASVVLISPDDAERRGRDARASFVTETS